MASSQEGQLLSLSEVIQGCLTGGTEPTRHNANTESDRRAISFPASSTSLFKSTNIYHRKEVPPTEMVTNRNLEKAVQNSNLSGGLWEEGQL